MTKRSDDNRKPFDRPLEARRDYTRTVLAIEASNPSSGAGGVCVARVDAGSAVVIGESVLESGVRSSDGVMVAVDEACQRADVRAGDIEEIAVSIGPGGYTALRIAATTAKTLAHVIGCPVVAVPTWAVAAESVGQDQRPALIALAGKGQAAHLTILDPNGGFDILGVTTAEQLESRSFRTLVGDEHVPASIADRCAELGMVRSSIVLNAPACASASARFEPRDADEIEPDYAREPDAVTQWRARHGG